MQGRASCPWLRTHIRHHNHVLYCVVKLNNCSVLVERFASKARTSRECFVALVNILKLLHRNRSLVHVI